MDQQPTTPIQVPLSGRTAQMGTVTYRVHKGQLLVELDARDNQISKEQSIGNLSQAQAAVRAQEPNVHITAKDQSTRVVDADLAVVSAKANVAAAQERYDSAIADLRQSEANAAYSTREEERYRQLVVKEEVSREQYDQRATKARADEAIVTSRRETANAAQKSVIQAESQLGMAQAQSDQTRHDLPKQITIQRETLAQRQG